MDWRSVGLEILRKVKLGSAEEVGCFWVVLGCRWLRNGRAKMLEVRWIWGMNFERFEGCWRSGLQWDEGGGNANLFGNGRG